MNERLEAIKSSILDSLDKAKTALNNKEVVVESLKVSEIPGYIRQIELNKIKLTVNCSEFESGTIKATKDGQTRTGTVQDGQCIIMLPSTGTWHIEHDLGDYVETEVKGDTSVELVKKKVTFSEGECSEEKITIHVDSVVGNNSNDNFIRVKKNGVIIEVQAQLKGSDIEITNFEYKEGATYTIEYVIKDEVRGSIEVEMVKGLFAISDETPIVDNDLLNKQRVKHLIFTDEKAPDSQETKDLAGDGSVVAWFIQDTQTYYVSTQKPGKKIKCSRLNVQNLLDSFSWFHECKYFQGPGIMASYNNSELETIDLKNFVITGDSTTTMFKNLDKLTEIKNLDKLDFSKINDFKSMFEKCEALTNLDLSSMNFESVNRMDDMFSSCSQLSVIYAKEWDAQIVSSSNRMFEGCTSLPNFNSSNVDISMAKWKENGGYFTNPAEKPS